MISTEFVDCVNCKSRNKSVFCTLENPELEALNDAKKCILFKKGEIILHEGSYPRGLYCVSSGKVKVVQLGVDGKEQIVHLAGSADALGFRAIISGDKYSCSAVALEDCSICFIPKEVFFSVVEKNPKVAMQVMHLFSKVLKQAEKQITNIAQRPVKERIAQCLLLLKECYGYEPDKKTLNVTLTREELANLSGTARETAIRLLFDLKEEKIIDLPGKKIAILNEKELIHIANLTD